MSVFVFLATYFDSALFVLRLVFGTIMMAHGLPKLRDLKGTAAAFDQMGFRPGKLFGTLAGILETFGGLAIIAGLWFQPVAALFVIQFIITTLWRIKKKHPFVSGWELDLLIWAVALFFLCAGAGIYSADASFFHFGF